MKLLVHFVVEGLCLLLPNGFKLYEERKLLYEEAEVVL